MTRRRVIITIATVLHISFPSLCFKCKWPYWLSWVKEAGISIKSISKEHLDDEVEIEELVARYSYKSPNIAKAELRRNTRGAGLTGG